MFSVNRFSNLNAIDVKKIARFNIDNERTVEPPNLLIGEKSEKAYKYFPKAVRAETWRQKEKYRDRSGEFGDAAYQFTADEITAYRKEIQHVLREEILAGDLTHEFIGNGLTKHEYQKWKNIQAPRVTVDFTRGDAVYTAKETFTKNLIGLDYDMYFSKVEIDAMNNPNVKIKPSETLLDGTKKEQFSAMGVYADEVKFLGTGGPSFTDLGITGLWNDADITDRDNSTGLDEDGSLIEPGDVLKGCVQLATNGLILNNIKPPYDVHMSPGVFAQALDNINATTNQSDMSFILEYGLDSGNKLFNKVVMNTHMTAATETTSTGALAVIKNEAKNFVVIESYRMAFYPLPAQGLGTEGKLLWMGATEVINPITIAIDTSCVTDVIS